MQPRRYNLILSFSDRRKNVGLSVVVPVCANAWGYQKSSQMKNGMLAVPRLIFSLKESALKASVIPIHC